LLSQNMKKILSFFSVAALIFSAFTSMALAGGKGPSYVYYASSSSAGTTVTCHKFDSAGNYIYCNIAGEDKAFGIAVDTPTGQYVQYGDRAFGIAVDETDSYMYHDGSSLTATSVNCNAIDTAGNYLLCNIAGEDKAFGIAVDDTPTGPYIQSGDRAFGIAVDDTDSSYTYYPNSSTAGTSVSCGSLDEAGNYVVCNIAGEDKAFGIAVDDTPTGQYVQIGDRAFGIAVDEVDAFTHYTDPTSIGTTVNCNQVDTGSNYLICNVGGTDKAFGIAVDTPTGEYIQSGDRAFGIAVD